MEHAKILHKVTEIMQELVDDDSLQLGNDTTSDDVEEWDSINHVKLILAIESEFNIRFQTHEINGSANIGELIGLIEGKLAHP